MNEALATMDNPVNSKEFRKWIFAALVASAIALAIFILKVSFWSPKNIAVTLFGVAFAFLFPFYLGWDGEYLRRPFKVEIRDDGILCHLRYNRKAKLIPWGEVISIGAHPVAPGKQPNRYEVDGTIWFKDERKKKEQYILHRSIAIAAREKYYEMMGRYPPMFYWERTDTVQYA